jgi:hypothetical protein
MAAAQVGQPYLLVRLVKDIVRGAPDGELYLDALYLSLVIFGCSVFMHTGFFQATLLGQSKCAREWVCSFHHSGCEFRS